MTIPLDQLMTPDEVANANEFAISVNPENGGGEDAPLNFYVVDVGRKWPNGSTLHVIIDNRSGKPTLTQKFKMAAVEWMKCANLRFKFTECKHWNPAKRTEAVHMWVLIVEGDFDCSSYVGTNCQYNVEKRKEPSMKLAFGTEKTYLPTIIHELGHAIGLQHEHLNPNVQIPWDKEAVYTEMGETWTKEQIDFNVFNPLRGNLDISTFDPDSIMSYSIPNSWVQKSARVKRSYYYIPPAKQISARDKQGASRAYPGNAHVVSNDAELLFRVSGKEILRMEAPFPNAKETSWVKNDAVTPAFHGLAAAWGWLYATDHNKLYRYSYEQIPDPSAKPTILWKAPANLSTKYIEQDGDDLVITLSDDSTSRISKAVATRS